jgi:hypothetical protein
MSGDAQQSLPGFDSIAGILVPGKARDKQDNDFIYMLII